MDKYKEAYDSVENAGDMHREYQKDEEYALKMAVGTGIPIVDGCKYFDYRQGEPGNPMEARNDRGDPPAPAVGASAVFHGQGTN